MEELEEYMSPDEGDGDLAGFERPEMKVDFSTAVVVSNLPKVPLTFKRLRCSFALHCRESSPLLRKYCKRVLQQRSNFRCTLLHSIRACCRFYLSVRRRVARRIFELPPSAPLDVGAAVSDHTFFFTFYPHVDQGEIKPTGTWYWISRGHMCLYPPPRYMPSFLSLIEFSIPTFQLLCLSIFIEFC